ncbi:TonB-dependent receptor domain-containing protein [Providencia burhodogranariea]|uniref:Outer membrane receptor for ferrienterochelin and colicins n=1 Tax=Providencia burhodogranariea DSM 19968 TaxID=1141662 RepID=K8WZY1_9GAMM|nr:TonB-dependent receptor [Providencia burhodogranariea]EKT62927.1 outer membrane receptor for ferrienterochelin and colicins [Providencia burhodogranariea DSM 19968]
MTNKNFRLTPLNACLLLCSFSVPSWAATINTTQTANNTQNNDAVQFNPLKVSTEGGGSESENNETQNSIYSTPAAVSYVSGKDIQEKRNGDINSVLRAIPGTFTRVSSSQPGIEVNIRGFEADGRVNTMIDGVPQTFRNSAGHASTGGELIYVDPNLLSGVSVERGSINGAAGMGALAGAVNFHTLDFDDVVLSGQNAGIRTLTKYGNNGSGFSGMLSGGAKTQLDSGAEADVVGGFSYSNYHNYRRGGKDGEMNVPNASNSPKSGLLKFHVKADDANDFKLGARWYNNGFLTSGYYWEMKNSTYTFNYAFTPDNDLVDFKFNSYYNVSKMSYDPTIGGSYTKRETEATTIGFDLANTSRFSFDNTYWFTWNYGGAYSHDHYAVNEYRGANPPGKMDKARAFTDLTVGLGMFDLTGAVNYDYWKLSGHRGPCEPGIGFCPPTGGDVDVSNRSQAVNPKVTLAANPVDWLQPYVSYGQTSRPPSAREALWALAPIGAGTGGGQYANLDLKPETSKGWELGTNVLKNDLFFSNDVLRLKVNYYNYDIKDFIYNASVAVPGEQYKKLLWVNSPGTTNSRGTEIQGTYDARVAYINLAYTHAKNDQPVGWGTGIGVGDISFLPDDTATIDIGVRLFDEDLTLGTAMDYVSGNTQASGFGKTERKESYRLYSVYGSYKINKHASTFFNIENLTNESYSPAMSGDAEEKSGRGRTFVVGLTTQF